MLYVGLMAGQGVNLWEVVLHAGTVARVVLLLLGLFSVTSWVIIFQKAMLMTRCKAATERFRAVFRKTADWRELLARTGDFSQSPLVGLFSAGVMEVNHQLRPAPGATAQKAQIRSIEAVERCLQRASVVEMGRMEDYLGILATIAAVSPFVGLFGTVWGIIDAFHGIGTAGNASLATVAPGISEALVATALGLVAAIPALMAYNFFQGQIKHWQTELDDFALEFIGLSERHFT